MKRQTCSTCAHDGCCADLPHCGGLRWQPAEEANDGDPWEGYDERDAMEEGCWATQQLMDEKW